MNNGLPPKALSHWAEYPHFSRLTPDAIMTGFNVPGGIGIGAAGRLYVADSVSYRVAVFAPGATGPAKPLWVLQLDTPNQPTQIALSERGLMYVGVSNRFVLIYLPARVGMPLVLERSYHPMALLRSFYDKKDLYILDYGRQV